MKIPARQRWQLLLLVLAGLARSSSQQFARPGGLTLLSVVDSPQAAAAAAVQPAARWRPRQRTYCSADTCAADIAEARAAGLEVAATASVAGGSGRRLPTAGPGGRCGHALGVCDKGLCCGQAGFCSRDAVACDGTCQCEFSGRGSKCRGEFPLTKPPLATLPVARRGGGCGRWLARCPAGQCCTGFGVCAADDSLYCGQSACQPDISSWTSTRCRAANAQLRKRVVRTTFVFTKGVVAPDGFKREAILVNGQFPAPAIRAEVGDRLIITCVNAMDEDVSLHSHGMLQRQSIAMDGVVAVTQRPILPGENFTYNYVADSPGTFWWHSHYATQYPDGARGALIIRDPLTPTWPAEIVLTVTEWYHVDAATITETFIFQQKLIDAKSILLNGIGIQEGTSCGATEVGACRYAKVKGVAAHCDGTPKTRLKLLHIGAATELNVTVDGHRMIIVAADGVSTEPTEVGSLLLTPGQRYDVLVCSRAPTLSTAPVWIRASTDVGAAGALSGKAVLYFTEAPPSTLPTSTPKYEPRLTFYPYDDGEADINPNALKTEGGSSVVPPPATKTLTFLVNFQDERYPGNETGLYAFVNNVSLVTTPYSPSLLERLSNNPEGLGEPANNARMGWQIITLNEGDTVDVIINNEDLGAHPFHLHGHWFWVMGWGPTVAPWLPNPQPIRYAGEPLAPTNIRDTAIVPNYSWLALRFVADNPGTWMFHCHVDHHLGMGMGVVFKEGLAGVRRRQP